MQRGGIRAKASLKSVLSQDRSVVKTKCYYMFRVVKKRVLDFLDYNYYRVAKSYFRREGTWAMTAICHVCLIIFFSIAPIFILLLMFIYHKFNIEWNEGREVVKVATILILIPIYLWVYNRYTRRGGYLALRERWYMEKKCVKTTRGIGVVLSVLIPLLLMILIARNRDTIVCWFDTF